ncbi:MAG: MBL fold metallo-hydrolase [Burkholderiaceae bacterium]|nr:MBL fold metallo-hydrolase [Burkholderiaceae bacterium]
MRLSDPLHGLTVLERGWLSSNNLLIHPAPGEPGAVLVDTGHVNHAPQTVALVQEALRGQPLARVLNTHLHSDHCGGNASLQRAFGVPVAIPPGLAQAVKTWDDAALSYAATGQRMERFAPQALLNPGDAVEAGGRTWEVLAAPGHDPHSVMLFDRAQGVLASADALWEHGFGVVFPEIDGEPGFDDVAAVLETIAALSVRVVVPGHGRPFTDVDAALERSFARIRGFQADPARHARHAVKVLVKYHLMEERAQPLDALLGWAETTPLLAGVWERWPPPGAASPRAWLQQVVADLVDGGALVRDGDLIRDA